MADLGRAFRQNLRQFILTGVTPLGKQLGCGSYGSVEEVRVINCMYKANVIGIHVSDQQKLMREGGLHCPLFLEAKYPPLRAQYN